MRTFIVFLFLIFLSCNTFTEVHEFCIQNNPNCIYHFEWSDDLGKSYTVFSTFKKVNGNLPNAYLKIRNGWRDGWEFMLKCEKDTIIIFIEPYHLIESVNMNDMPIKVEQLKDTLFYKIYFDEKNTNFIKLSSYDIYYK
jgi:hypothetical protein